MGRRVTKILRGFLRLEPVELVVACVAAGR